MFIPSRAPQSFIQFLFRQKPGHRALASSLGLLLFALGCGSNGTNVPGPYSKSSLNGTYVVRLSGNDAFLDNANNEQDESYTETLILKADGAGHLTGVEDFNSSRFGFSGGNTFSGTYDVAHDGNGSMTINFTGGSSGQINLSITLASTTKFYVAEADAFINFSANATGVGVLQSTSTSALTAAPTGTFIMRAHLTSLSEAHVGALASASGTTVTGTLDVLRSGQLLPQLTLTNASFSAPDSNGTGTLTYTENGTVTTAYRYYIVDANTFWLMESDTGLLGTGTAEKQATGALSLAGNFAFGSSGDTATTGGVRSVGVFSASGGSITAGTLDSVQDNVSTLNQPFTGNYTEGANGRVTVSLVPTGGAAIMIPEVFWMVSNSRAYFLIDTNTKVEDGTLDMQTQNTFAATDFKSQFGYAMVMDGYLASTGFLTRIGTLYPDGNGNLALNEEVNSLVFPPPPTLPGSVNDPPTLNGTYQVGSNGRITGVINTLSSNLVGYMVSPGQVYWLQNDTGAEISGQLTLQASP